jgi:hypothetical protein
VYFCNSKLRIDLHFSMKLNTIFLKGNSKFSNALQAWATDRNFELAEFNDKSENADEGIDGLVIFNENQEMDRETVEIRALFDNNQKPVHKIDINGTLMVGVSNLDLWLERNSCKKVLIVGSDSLVSNVNLERFISNLK